jgi:hypothetical protein
MSGTAFHPRIEYQARETRFRPVKNTREERKEKKEARINVSETAHRSRHGPAARAQVEDGS